MDQERFDHITRTLATGQSRRGLLKGLTGTAIGGLLVAAGIGETAAKPEVPCKAPNAKYGKGRNAVCCTPGQTYNASTNACITPTPCTPDCTGKCGGASDGCTGTCNATCPSTTCPQVDCNIAIDNGDGTCWYTPAGNAGATCNNLYYGVGAGICDNMGNCLPPT
jgi:hypothetical protein